MPKITNHPRLRTLVRKGASGQRWVYYYFDMRSEGKPDIPLGKDHAQALAQWDALYNRKPRSRGRLQEGIDLWREKVLVGSPQNPSPYTNADTRRDYTRHLKRIELWCGEMAWHEMTLPLLMQYLRARKGKTQANRELSVLQLVWNHARMHGLTQLPWPAAGLKGTAWKNPETPREAEVTDEVFEAIYAAGDQLLRDAMDLASATSMRIKDVRSIPLPPSDVLRLKASKTGKKVDFDINLSQVLPDLIARRRANKRALHLKLLSTSTGREVSYAMLNGRFAKAREAAAVKAEEARNSDLAAAIRSMIQRDCRKYAADKADSIEDAQKLLQHSSPAITLRHYRTKAERVRPVR